MGPGRRAWQLASAVAAEGHETRLLWVDPQPAGVSAGRTLEAASLGNRSIEETYIRCADLGRDGARECLEAPRSDAIVAATVHASAWVAKNAPQDIPLWFDVFGDPLAEAQAKAAADGNDLALARYWEALVTALERADRVSAVSQAQAFALIGQLGLVGRLTGGAAGHELVSVIPCAAERDSTQRDPSVDRRFPEGAFVALFGGSFNTWCDVPTWLAGVEQAMDVEPSIHVAVTGGPVQGHDESTFARFLDRRAASRHASRILYFGWLERRVLTALYARADVGVNVERELYERRLGAENRVVDWMAHGVPAITTGLSEMGRKLVDAGLAFGVPVGDPSALAATLVRLARDRSRVRETAERCEQHAARHLRPATTCRPLVDWCTRPTKLGAECASPLRIALASEPRALSGLLESYLAELGAVELGYRSVRWLWRRFVGAARRRRA